MQNLSPTHETLLSSAPSDGGADSTCGGSGGTSSDQPRPFHRSATGTTAPASVSNSPTAVHALADVHDTESRLPAADVVTAACCSIHASPVHRSASVRPVLKVFSTPPTNVPPTATHTRGRRGTRLRPAHRRSSSPPPRDDVSTGFRQSAPQADSPRAKPTPRQCRPAAMCTTRRPGRVPPTCPRLGSLSETPTESRPNARSRRVPVGASPAYPVMSALPTATQRLADGQEDPVQGGGVQRWVTARSLQLPRLAVPPDAMACPPRSLSANSRSIVPPTAVQDLADTHATAWSELPDECVGCEVGCISSAALPTFDQRSCTWTQYRADRDTHTHRRARNPSERRTSGAPQPGVD